MNLLVLPGDGIGPEIVQSTVTVLGALGRRHGLDFRYTTREIGFAALERGGTTLPNDILDIARSVDASRTTVRATGYRYGIDLLHAV